MAVKKITDHYGKDFPCVVAIDPGIKTGYAIWRRRDKKPTEYGVTSVGNGKHIFRILFGLLLIEDQYLGLNPKTLMSLCINVGRWTERGNINGYAIETVHPKTWQAAIGAKGKRPAIKKASAQYARLLTGDKNVPQDAADAICLGSTFLATNRIGIT